jgi:hypothetical protein
MRGDIEDFIRANEDRLAFELSAAGHTVIRTRRPSTPTRWQPPRHAWSRRQTWT